MSIGATSAQHYCLLPTMILSTDAALLHWPLRSFFRTVKHAMPRKFVMSLMTRVQNRAYDTKETVRVTKTTTPMLCWLC